MLTDLFRGFCSDLANPLKPTDCYIPSDHSQIPPPLVHSVEKNHTFSQKITCPECKLHMQKHITWTSLLAFTNLPEWDIQRATVRDHTLAPRRTTGERQYLGGSHLCGNGDCQNPTHVVVETYVDSNRRALCHNRRECICGQSPPCLVALYRALTRCQRKDPSSSKSSEH